ncbi:hypothetical protein D0T87_10720 [Bacteroides sp. 51]|nr:hypothetical protein [Bacteroides sp. 51]
MVFFSCNDDNDLLLENQESISPKTNDISITEEGFLSFSSFNALEKVINDIELGEKVGITSKAIVTRAISRDFESVATLRHQIDDFGGGGGGYTPPPLPIDDDIEEMTIHEYRLMKAEELLLDNVLAEVLDTTLRIGVNDIVYKITDYGTFSAHKNKVIQIDRAIANFNPSIISGNEAGASIQLNNDVTFTNTFGGGAVQPTATSVQVPANYNPDFHNGYNCTTFSWKNNSLWQKFWDWVRGKDVTKEVKFDKNNRVQVEVFNVNYQFYASSGIKVKMQKRKKFLGITYWKSKNAEKMAIGFNMLSGEMKYTNPRSFSSITPTGSTGWGKFTGTINNISHSYVLGTYHKFEIIKDWVDDIYFWMPEVNISYPGGNYTIPNLDLLNKLYDAPAEQVFSQLKSLAGQTVYKPIQKKIQPKDPRMSYFMWGNANVTYNKDKSYIIGVQEYTNKSSKTVRFDRSFGINFNNGSVSGFIPTEFKIKDLDMFGACYYNKQWKGVRFVK